MTRRIVITGGGTGIGLATARRFLAEKPSIVLIGRRRGVLEAAAEELRAMDEDLSIAARCADLTDPEEVRRLAEDLSLGAPIDVIVANAGGNYGDTAGGSLPEIAKAWRADFEGNVLSAVLLTEALLPQLSRPGGRIIAMSSVAAIRGAGSYGAAKAALNAWVLSMSTRLAPEGITVNAVAPGFVPDTEFWRDRLEADPSLYASRVENIPMHRAGTPEEIAEAVAYLASPDAGWTTGQILQVNGGTVLGRG